MPRLVVPILNPVNVVDINRELPVNYHFKHFDGWNATEQILEFEAHKCDIQKWQKNDIIRLQVSADFSPIIVQVRNRTGLVVLSQVMSAMGTVAGMTYYQNQVALDTFDEGYYMLEILGGSPALITLQTAALDIRESHPSTLLIEYSNSFNNHILWEYRGYMTIRVDGVIPFDAPTSVRTVYIDQPGAAKTVKGDAARRFKLYVGCSGGQQNWLIDKLEEIVDQTDVTYDGKPFAPVPGSTWNTKKIDRYPWAQWNIDMREAINRREKIFETDGIQDKKVAMDYVVEGKLFGPVAGNPASDNSYTINRIS